MQNKTKLFLVSVVVFLGGFLMAGRVRAELPWCCLLDEGKSSQSCREIDSGKICSTAEVQKSQPCSTYCKATPIDACTTGTCQPSSGCKSFGSGTCADAQNKCCLDSGTADTCSTVCVPSASCAKPISGKCSTSGQVCCASGNCTPDCSCASSTAVGSTCSDKCGGTCQGKKSGGTTSPGVIVPSQLAGLPTNPNLVKGIFTNVANFLLSIIGIIAIISFVISGIQYFLVATDEKMMETAKKTMVYSIIGLVVALFGYIAIKTVEMLLKG